MPCYQEEVDNTVNHPATGKNLTESWSLQAETISSIQVFRLRSQARPGPVEVVAGGIHQCVLVTSPICSKTARIVPVQAHAAVSFCPDSLLRPQDIETFELLLPPASFESIDGLYPCLPGCDLLPKLHSLLLDGCARWKVWPHTHRPNTLYQ